MKTRGTYARDALAGVTWLSLCRWLGVLVGALLGIAAPAIELPVQSSASGDRITVSWSVPEGYYLFRSKLKVRSLTPEVTVTSIDVPDGTVVSDPFFGDVAVLTGQVTVSVSIRISDVNLESVELESTAQACQFDGDCSPLRSERMTVDISAPGAAVEEQSLTALLSGSLGGSFDDFLDPDVAFVLSTGMDSTGTLHASWQIAESYYLYRDKIAFAVIEPEGLGLDAPDLPAGKVKTDEFFGTVAVFYDEVRARLAFPGVAQATPVKIQIKYQGCADAGLCYPPIKKIVDFVLPAAAAAVNVIETDVPQIPTQSPSVAFLPEQDRIARTLATENTLWVMLTFVGFGLLLTFTPCVLPMIPILSSIIVGQGENLTTRRAFVLSLVYVLAMSLTYTVAGVLAGLFGANLQSAFQNPWVLSTFSLVFVLLSLSMFGFYDLQIPAGLQAKLAELSSRQQGGTFMGVAIMGFLSALIVGPCVAAPLAGALIYIGQSGDAVLGGMALFALSLGMGIPLLIVGTSAGRLLPRVGAWMGAVKAVFGVLLLGVAIYLLERIIPGWISMLLWALLLIVSAIYVGALDTLGREASGWRRLCKGSGLAMLVYGVLLMVGAAAGGDDVLRPLKTVTGAGYQQPKLEFRQVKGIDGVQGALQAAGGRPTMLDFYADWCVSCKELEKYTFSDIAVQAMLNGMQLLQVDVTDNDESDQVLLKELKLFGPPAILFYGSDGEERENFRVVGYLNAESFLDHVTAFIGSSKSG